MDLIRKIAQLGNGCTESSCSVWSVVCRGGGRGENGATTPMAGGHSTFMGASNVWN